MIHKNGKMGVVVTTAMSVTIVVGAGLLTLPGITFAHTGRLGYLPWLLVALLMIPLLCIFSFFAREYPSAGGVVGYIRSSLGERLASAAEIIALGTFTLGIPAIALIGAEHFQQYLPYYSPQTIAILLISIALVTALLGLKLSGAIQTAIATAIVFGVLLIVSGFLMVNDLPNSMPDVVNRHSFEKVASAVPLVLFAFTGWEMTAFLAEDMENPKQDLPRSIWASFVIVVILYGLVAWTVATYAEQEPLWVNAPVLAMSTKWLGEGGSKIVGMLITALVLANVIAAFTSASRAIFSAGRDGLLPRSVGTTTSQGSPIFAIFLTYVIFILVILTTYIDGFNVSTLLQLAGQNFFVLYLLSAAGYVVLQRSLVHKWLGYFAFVIVVASMSLFSLAGLLYCGLLGVLGYYIANLEYKFKSI